MKQMLTKKNLMGLSLLLTFLMVYILLNRYYQLREAYYRDYLRYKEVMLLMKNYRDRKREEPSEDLLRSVLSNAGGELISLRQTDVGYEVKGRKLPGAKIPQMVYTLEERGIKIVKFKAIDNTGQGLFDVEMLIR
ncbi:MAG: hypothetical protein KNN13_07410 [Hydrogenobacter thermophilus]|nr:MAG: hypothetical protein KNN13_07410 [Hydrogenobacter thermophilus]